MKVTVPVVALNHFFKIIIKILLCNNCAENKHKYMGDPSTHLL